MPTQVAGKPHRIHPSVILAVRLLALTGLRRGELLGSPHAVRRGGVAGLRWKHVDLDAGIFTLEDSKTGSQRRVIGEAAVDLLREVRPKSAHPDDCVCPGPGNSRRPYRAINNARRLIWQGANLPSSAAATSTLSATPSPASAPTSTAAACRVRCPPPGPRLPKRSITERYIHQNLEALRPAADAIAARIAKALAPKDEGKVVPFRPGTSV